MDDTKRLKDLIAKAEEIGRLEEGVYQRMMELLQTQQGEFGQDREGRQKVAFFDARRYEREAFEKANTKADRPCSFNFLKARLTPQTAELAKGHRVVCVFVHDEVDAATVKVLADLGVQLIALRCAGFNNVDLGACRDRGVDVVRVPAYSPHAVAEHAVALMLVLNRKLHLAAERVRTKNFTVEGLVGFDMYGKVAGVVGGGKIGKCAAEILLGFGCQVLVFDPHQDPELAARKGLSYTTLDELFKQSDIITLHVPLIKETHYMINADTLKLMKDGVMIINTSRGALLDSRALIDGLKSGKVGAAGLDVYEEEEGVFFQDLSHYENVLHDDVLARLCSFSNVMITSHQGFLTKEALANIAETTIENIDAYRKGQRGKELMNFVT